MDLTGNLTFCIFLDDRVAKLNHVNSLVIANVFAKDHVFVKVARIKNTCRKSKFFDIRVDMIFA